MLTLGEVLAFYTHEIQLILTNRKQTQDYIREAKKRLSCYNKTVQQTDTTNLTNFLILSHILTYSTLSHN